MASIVFIMDTEEGHILPSFGLAHSLKSKGHDISYLSIIDNEHLATEQGFKFYPMLEHVYPRGYRQKLKERDLPGGKKEFSKLNDVRGRHLEEIMNGAYDGFLKSLNADLFIINVFLYIDILLLYYKFNIRPVILTPFLREEGKTVASDCMDHIMVIPPVESYSLIEYLRSLKVEFTSLPEIVGPLDMFCELVLCPHELDINIKPAPLNSNYIGPSIRKAGPQQDIRTVYNIPGDKKIIYASMGSQAIRHGDLCDVFFGKMTHVMDCPALQDFHLVLNVGPEYDTGRIKFLPNNVTVVGWVSQIAMLEVASMAITHGGLGSIKECIYHGVPMIVFPLGYDQPLNARRVMYHNLGMAGNIETVSVDDLRSHILSVAGSDVIRNAITNMQKIFRAKEEAQPGVGIIEKILAEKNSVLK